VPFGIRIDRLSPMLRLARAVEGINSCLVGKGRVIRPLASRFNANFVVHGGSELLLAAEVVFGCLDGDVTEEELDLVELPADQMTETRTCPSQIVGRQLIYSGSLSRSLDDLPEHLRRHALAPDLT
jgi:hypothetical protein